MELNSTAGKLLTVTSCTVQNIRRNDGRLRFSRLDGAPPLFPADAGGIPPWALILEELNDYRLKVTGLPAGAYSIQLDGTKISQMTADNWRQE